MNNSNFNYSAAFPGLNMLSPMSHMPDNMPPGHGMGNDNPYKSLIERMKDSRDDEDSRDTRDSDLDKAETGQRKDLGPMPFSILPPHMLNMMERIKAEDKEKMMKDEMDDRDDIASSPMNLSSERDTDKRMSETRSVEQKLYFNPTSISSILLFFVAFPILPVQDPLIPPHHLQTAKTHHQAALVVNTTEPETGHLTTPELLNRLTSELSSWQISDVLVTGGTSEPALQT